LCSINYFNGINMSAYFKFFGEFFHLTILFLMVIFKDFFVFSVAPLYVLTGYLAYIASL